MADNSIPQGFSVFQPALGAHLEFFPAVGTQELDDLINAYIPGPALIQEKRATVALDFLEYAQLTGQTFKFYAVYAASFTQSPASDSASSFNASPATSSWDWSRASVSSSSQSSINGRQPRNPSPGTVSRHQTADFSHLPGMKIMTKDGRDVTNTASRGSKTKEQRDHAHLMRIIKACDSCKRKKVRCDPSHKKRGAAQQPAQSSKVTKKTKVAAPPRPQPPTASPPTFGGDDFLAQAPIDWNASFTFADLEMPEFAMPFEPIEDLAEQANLIPEDYDFLFNNPEGYFSSSSASPFGLASSAESPGSAPVLAAPGFADTQNSIPGPYRDSAGGSVDSYSDFALYSPSSSFSEDDHMVSIEASSERFSTKSVSQSPAEQSKSQSQSPTDLSQSPADLSSSSIQPHIEPWYNDGIDWSAAQEPTATSALDDGFDRDAAFARNAVDEFHDAEWLCDPSAAENSSRAPGSQPVCDRGADNADLMAAYESTVSVDGIAHTGHRVRTVNHSSTSTDSCGRYSTTTETDTVMRQRVRPDDAGTHHNVAVTEQSPAAIQPRLPDDLTPPGDVVPHGERAYVAVNATEPHVERAYVAVNGTEAHGEVAHVAVIATEPHGEGAHVAVNATGPHVERLQDVERLHVQGTAAAATDRSVQRLVAGVHKPSVESIPPLSSQTVLLVIGLALAAVILRSAVPASLMLSVLAVVLRMSPMMGLPTSQPESTSKPLGSWAQRHGTSTPMSVDCRSSLRRSERSTVLTDLSFGRLLSV